MLKTARLFKRRLSEFRNILYTKFWIARVNSHKERELKRFWPNRLSSERIFKWIILQMVFIARMFFSPIFALIFFENMILFVVVKIRFQPVFNQFPIYFQTVINPLYFYFQPVFIPSYSIFNQFSVHFIYIFYQFSIHLSSLSTIIHFFFFFNFQPVFDPIYLYLKPVFNPIFTFIFNQFSTSFYLYFQPVFNQNLPLISTTVQLILSFFSTSFNSF